MTKSLGNLGKYEILEELGQGGFATVEGSPYLAMRLIEGRTLIRKTC